MCCSNQGKEATMFRPSIGGRDAALRVYRHALVRVMIPLWPALDAGIGWSALALCLCSVLMSWDAAPTLAQRFESALAVLDAALPRRRRVPRTYQGFIKALSTRGRSLPARLGAHLRTLTRRAAGRAWRIGEFIPIGVDGSKFDAPRTIGNEPLGFAGKDKCGPQMMALLLVHLGSMLPWAFKVGPARVAERTLLRSMQGLLPPGTLLVADAGFTGFDLISGLLARGVHVLIRVGRGARLLTDLGYAQREGKSTVYLWPDQKQDRPPLVLRLIRVGDVYLVTSVTDPRRLSNKAAAELYRRRWGLEVAFRSLKQTLQRRKVRSGTASHARAELDWAALGLWMLALIGAHAVGDPRGLSPAAALSAVRAARHTPGSDRKLRARLRRAVRDRYRRTGPKKAWRWPHKKHPPAPGAPRLTRATTAQVLRAKALRTPSQAA
jgi:Transposase DDE domain